MRNILKGLFVIGSVIALSACGGPANFVKPTDNTFALGKTKSDEVLKIVGKPAAQQDGTINNEKIHNIAYSYAENPSFWGVIINHRDLVYATYNDTLVSEMFNSTFDGESTKFEYKNISKLKVGMTELDVIGLLGKPSGKAIYPIVKNKNDRGDLWVYSYARFAGMFTSQNIFYLLVTVNEQGIVTDILYKKDGKQQDLASAATVVEAPVPEKK